MNRIMQEYYILKFFKIFPNWRFGHFFQKKFSSRKRLQLTDKAKQKGDNMQEHHTFKRLTLSSSPYTLCYVVQLNHSQVMVVGGFTNHT